MRLESNCQVCGTSEWNALPDPESDQSVTTAGRIVGQPLGKSQCKRCGFVQRNRVPFLGFTDYYEQDYANYYERPGTEKYHLNRYKAIIDWMCTFIRHEHFNRVLDVGCGQGWAMDAFTGLYPEAGIEGVEPSKYNVERARKKGYQIYEGKLENGSVDAGLYDIVFSNNVIQHVNNAQEFLVNCKNLIKDDGVIIVTCPDGSRPNIELLWADQNYSFLPQHLIAMARKLDMETVFWTQSPASNPSLPPAQLLVITNNSAYHDLGSKDIHAVEVDIERNFREREAYLESFAAIDQYILGEIGDENTVYNLGASYWTSILAAYCPHYWEKVTGCVVDDPGSFDRFMGKPVHALNTIDKEKNTLVLGTSPAGHTTVKDKMDGWLKIIGWDQFARY